LFGRRCQFVHKQIAATYIGPRSWCNLCRTVRLAIVDGNGLKFFSSTGLVQFDPQMGALLQDFVNDTQAASLKECESIEKKLEKMLSKMEEEKQELKLESVAKEASNSN
jgi:hypothetical protein